MHEYRRFVQAELDARGWKQADLVRHSKLSRALISKILNDKRPNLGQMPDESTLKGIARGFGIPAERVRIAAARSLARYEDDGTPIATDLSEVDIDVLLAEVRRRVVGGSASGGTAEPPLSRGRPQWSNEPQPGLGEHPDFGGGLGAITRG